MLLNGTHTGMKMQLLPTAEGHNSAILFVVIMWPDFPPEIRIGRKILLSDWTKSSHMTRFPIKIAIFGGKMCHMTKRQMPKKKVKIVTSLFARGHNLSCSCIMKSINVNFMSVTVTPMNYWKWVSVQGILQAETMKVQNRAKSNIYLYMFDKFPSSSLEPG